MRNALALLAALALTASAMSAEAAACRDAKGKFIKCPAPAAKVVGPCKDAKGKFMKCGAAKG